MLARRVLSLAPTPCACRHSLLAATTSSYKRQPTAAVHHHRERGNQREFLGLRRGRKANRHWLREWAAERGRKYLKIVLPIEKRLIDKMTKGDLTALTPAAYRAHLLKSGMRPVDLQPSRPWQPSQIDVSTLGEVTDPFVPPKVAKATWTEMPTAMKEKVYRLPSTFPFGGKDSRHWTHIKKTIKNLAASAGDAFDTLDNKESFVAAAFRIFVAANNALRDDNDAVLRDTTTTLAYKSMRDFIHLSTLDWQCGELADGDVVRARHVTFPEHSTNIVAQITVRFQSKQRLAVYDQFGRLKLGSADRTQPPQDVTDYVVFERHISSPWGRWRVHSMLFPADYRSRHRLARTGPLTTTDDDVDARSDIRQRMADSEHGGRARDDDEGDSTAAEKPKLNAT